SLPSDRIVAGSDSACVNVATQPRDCWAPGGPCRWTGASLHWSKRNRAVAGGAATGGAAARPPPQAERSNARTREECARLLMDVVWAPAQHGQIRIGVSGPSTLT